MEKENDRIQHLTIHRKVSGELSKQPRDDLNSRLKEKGDDWADGAFSLAPLHLIFWIHGGIVGSASDNLATGLLVGLFASVLVDLCMEDRSLVIGFMRCVIAQLVDRRLESKA